MSETHTPRSSRERVFETCISRGGRLKTIGPMALNYHAHIFFSADEVTEAEAIRRRLDHCLPNDVKIGAFLPRAAGPLPAPMFQLDYPAVLADRVEDVLRQHTCGYSVLIHPLLADELAAHTTHATWLGPVLALRLDRL